MGTYVDGEYLSTTAVAEMLHVSPKTVNRWVQLGKLQPESRTLGGHARFKRSEIEKLKRELLVERNRGES